MKRLFGILVMGLVVGIVGCATNVEKGDELAQQGKYEEAIELYEQVKSDDEEYGKSQEKIANCNYELGEIEFNGKNWEKAIYRYERVGTPKAKERIANCNFELGEIEFNGKNWKKAIDLYEKAQINDFSEKIILCKENIAAERIAEEERLAAEKLSKFDLKASGSNLRGSYVLGTLDSDQVQRDVTGRIYDIATSLPQYSSLSLTLSVSGHDKYGNNKMDEFGVIQVEDLSEVRRYKSVYAYMSDSFGDQNPVFQLGMLLAKYRGGY